MSAHVFCRGVALLVFATACGAAGLTDAPAQTNPTIDTNTAGGRLAFYTDGPVTGGLDVTVDGQAVGRLTEFLTTIPTCGDPGTLTVNVRSGLHSVSGRSASRVWSNVNVGVNPKACQLFLFSVEPTASH